MKREIAEKLLEIQAVSLNPNEPFTWSSGLKSPIYCDNRSTIGFPEIRGTIAEGLASLIRENFPGVECISGTATAGIPHAALVSERLNLPMNYVRSKAKAHGAGKQIEGQALKGQKVVVVEDLISTGGSAITTVQALRGAGCEVLGVVSIFTYELEKAEQNLRLEEISSVSLSDLTTLVDVAEEKGYIQKAELDSLLEWKKDPQEWAKQFS
ncbi:orotate phosphoribosyltransferase [Bacillus sp. CGMCC 1.16607]|uniref:orotate phosphoribosyltransferase n=1 Tax=Bacillus sp. CGMCC 1.16607 TaxID=3351842 RepID=UPI003642C457